MKFYISDTHFNCTNTFENRTLEHDALIHDNWNKNVTNADEVYILGDVGRVSNNRDIEYICSLIASLKGKKKTLIVGNHDDSLLKDVRFTNLFSEICNYKELIDNIPGRSQKIVMCHYPIYSWNGAYAKGKNNRILLYGHTHNNWDDQLFQNSLKEIRCEIISMCDMGVTELGFPYAFNVGAMMPTMNYSPQPLQQIIKGGSENGKA